MTEQGLDYPLIIREEKRMYAASTHRRKAGAGLVLRILRAVALTVTLSVLTPKVACFAATPFTDMAEVASGGGDYDGVFTCGLNLSGGIKCWGVNDKGQLGNNSLTASTVPVDVSGLTSGAIQISAGRSHACAVTSSGTVKCWGENTYGQLGNNSTTTSSTPVTVSGLSGVTKVRAGRDHTCALASAGIKCWGRNDSGQLAGSGVSTCSGVSCSLVPVTAYASGMIDVATGSYHTCAVSSGGAVTCWGNNAYGQLGNNSTSSSYSPVNAQGLSSGIAQVSAGNQHSCARTTAGEVFCWGSNAAYELGYDSVSSCSGIQCSKVPSYVLESGYSTATGFADISTSPNASHNCGLTTGGGVRCWGSNISQELGAIASDDCLAGINNCSRSPLSVTGNASGLVSVSAGEDYSCAVTTSGSIRCWGLGSYTPSDKIGVFDYFLIGGTITLDSAPFSGVTVTGTGLGTQSTAGDGSYSFTNVIEQTAYSITPSKAGYCFSPASASGTLSADATKDFSAFQCYVISGIVTAGSSPLSGVTMDGGALGTTMTDSSGEYRFNRAPAGASYTITPSKTGYTFQPSSRSGTATHDVSASFSATHTLSGRITTSGGTPIQGVSVFWGLYGTQTTDSNGEYSYTGVPSGTAYSLSFSKTGYSFSPSTATGTLTAHTTRDSTATALVYTISGYLRTAASAPIMSYTVNGGALGNVTTNSSGFYTFSNVPYGTAYTITPSTAYYVFSPTSTSGTITGNVSANFTGTRTYSISGTVRLGGSPLSGVTISAGSLGTQTTNGSGQYQFSGAVEGANYSVQPSLSGYSFSPSSFPVIPYGNSVADFTAAVYTPTPTPTSTQTSIPSATPTVPIPTPTATTIPTLSPTNTPIPPTPTEPTDQSPPSIKALSASGIAGKSISLSYTIADTSGSTAETVEILQKAKILKSIQLPLATIPATGKRTVKWSSKGKKKGSYQFCVRASDPFGNSSEKSCAKLTLK